MTLPYFARLICQVLACFFILYALATAGVSLGSAAAIRAAARRHPRSAATVLLTLRLLPAALAVFTAACLCLPSYLWFEGDSLDEPVGFLSLVIASLGAALIAFAVFRGVRASVKSLRFSRDFAASAQRRDFAWIIESRRPCLALTGILRPRIVVSQGIVSELSAEELVSVLAHENAHRAAFDNVKRLMIRMAPGSRALERAWMKYAEYAADQRAAAGDARKALTLASALVRVARFGNAGSLPVAATAFLADASELSLRVERLLAPPALAEPARPSRLWALLLPATALFHPAALRAVHELLELFLR